MGTRLVAHHRRTLAYDDWANAETSASLREWAARLQRQRARRSGGSAAGRERAGALRRARLLFAHIVAAEILWLARVHSERPPLAVWPTLELDACDEWSNSAARGWHDLFATLRPRDLDRVIAYVNSKGETWSSTIGDIVTHVVVHSAYHRGQIAALARGAGATPAYTDFIHCTRLEAVAPLGAPVVERRKRRRARADGNPA